MHVNFVTRDLLRFQILTDTEEFTLEEKPYECELVVNFVKKDSCTQLIRRHENSPLKITKV